MSKGYNKELDLLATLVCYVRITLCFNSTLNCQIMKKNMGTVDKVIRILVAVTIAILYFTNVVSGTLGIILLIFASIFVLTSLIGFCPLYKPIGLNTGKKE